MHAPRAGVAALLFAGCGCRAVELISEQSSPPPPQAEKPGPKGDVARRLLSCGDFALDGVLTATGDASQPSFTKFVAHAGGGRGAVAVETRDVVPLPLARVMALSVGPASDGKNDVLVQLPPRLAGWRTPLSTLRVTVDGRAVTHAGGEAAPFGGGAANVTITQDKAAPIGPGFSEAVAIASPSAALTLRSLADAHTITNGMPNVRIDLKISHLDKAMCVGMLPEIWGILPMSSKTQQLLSGQEGAAEK